MKTLTPTRITQAAEIVRAGGVILYPTDTAYALGCDWKNEDAIRRIKKIKRRTKNAFTLIAASFAQVQKKCPLSPCQTKIAQQYWPGPLSIVISARFSVRVPAFREICELAKRLDTFLLATSANISGEPELHSLDEEKNPDRAATIRHLRASVDTVLDAGDLPQRPPSTIVRCVNNTVTILRHGAIAM